jgi:hypothetical protein
LDLLPRRSAISTEERCSADCFRPQSNRPPHLQI